MTTVLCVVDGQPVADQAVLCSDCGGRLDNALAAITELAPELDVTLTRQSRQAQPAGVRTDELTDPYEGTPYDTIKQQRKETAGAVVQALPFHGGASNVRTELQTAVIGWARHVAEERGYELPAGGAVEAARWLRGHVEWIRHRDEAGEAYGDLMRVRARLVAVVDIPRHLVFDGRCRACNAELYAPEGARRGECGSCGAAYDPDEQYAWAIGQLDDDTLMTAGEISRATRVPASTVRSWPHRGRIITRPPRAGDPFKQPLYRMGDVRDLLAGEAARSGGGAA